MNDLTPSFSLARNRRLTLSSHNGRGQDQKVPTPNFCVYLLLYTRYIAFFRRYQSNEDMSGHDILAFREFGVSNMREMLATTCIALA